MPPSLLWAPVTSTSLWGQLAVSRLSPLYVSLVSFHFGEIPMQSFEVNLIWMYATEGLQHLESIA